MKKTKQNPADRKFQAGVRVDVGRFSCMPFCHKILNSKTIGYLHADAAATHTLAHCYRLMFVFHTCLVATGW